MLAAVVFVLALVAPLPGAEAPRPSSRPNSRPRGRTDPPATFRARATSIRTARRSTPTGSSSRRARTCCSTRTTRSNWYPWGDEAFARARRELGRPVLLSVGYSTCHWCHVMEEESFEDEEIARYLNEHYIAIKVDREERPDVDAIYMSARAGADRRRRLADDGVAHARPPAVLRRHLLPAARRRPRRAARLPDRAAQARRARIDEQPGRRSPTAADEPRRDDAQRASPAARRREPARPRRVLRRRGGRLSRALRRAVRRPARAPKFPSDLPDPLPAPLPAAHAATRRRSRWRRRRSSRWRPAASTTRSAAASIATRPTRGGWCRTSRRCSTTTRCSRVAYLEAYQATGRDDFAAVAREILR